jgi:serine/threonine protein phosphatase PrpC
MEIAHRIERAPNEAVCGDAFLIVENGPSVLIVVADGEGHGPAASEASRQLCEYIANNSEQRLDDLLWGAHRNIKGDRGVAVIALRVDRHAHSLSFCGVGNVELQTLSKVPIRPVCDRGMVGRRVRRVTVHDFPLNSGDLLIVHSDGVSARLSPAHYRRLSVQEIAEAAMRDHRRIHDDAICVAIRY